MSGRSAAALRRSAPAPPAETDGLDAVRTALSDRARADATQATSAARDRAEAVIAAAREQAGAIGERARAEGAAAAERLLAAERARARRAARQRVLAARSRALDDLRDACLRAAEGLSQETGYPALTDRLVAVGRARLGDDAVVEVDGPEGAGVVARAGNRRVDLRLTELATRAVAHLGPRLEELWR